MKSGSAGMELKAGLSFNNIPTKIFDSYLKDAEVHALGKKWNR